MNRIDKLADRFLGGLAAFSVLLFIVTMVLVTLWLIGVII